MDDVWLALVKEVLQAQDVERAKQAGLQAKDLERHAGLLNLQANRPRLVNAQHRRLVVRRQMAHQVQDHFFRAADGEGVRQEQHPRRRLGGHEAWLR